MLHPHPYLDCLMSASPLKPQVVVYNADDCLRLAGLTLCIRCEVKRLLTLCTHWWQFLVELSSGFPFVSVLCSVHFPASSIDVLSCQVETLVITSMFNRVILLFTFPVSLLYTTHTQAHTHNEIIGGLKCIFSVHLTVSMWGSTWCWYTAL